MEEMRIGFSVLVGKPKG